VRNYTIDRVESEWATLEDENGRTFNIPRDWLPADAREGDVLNASGVEAAGANLLRLTVDPEKREERLDEAAQRREALPRGPKGDVKL
jgi:DUF3006 family protein